MMSYINKFLSTEITCLPSLMEKYLGNYFSNVIGNALFWTLIIWCIVRLAFDEYLNRLFYKKMLIRPHLFDVINISLHIFLIYIFFKQMNLKKYKRKRLVKSLWYCGFYGTAFIFCAATLWSNNESFLKFAKNLPQSSAIVNTNTMLGFGLFGTFFMHSSIWDFLRYEHDLQNLAHLVLTVLTFFMFTSRRVEFFLALLVLISWNQFIFNTLRCVVSTKKAPLQKVLTICLFGSLTLCALINVVIIPAVFLLPIMKHLVSNPGVLIIMTSLILFTWWIADLISSPLYKIVIHWIYHSNTTDKKICPLNLAECYLFPPRDDTVYNLQIIKQEIKEREEDLISKRKPKSRGMLIQTLKCMVAIKRKLNKKRHSESSDSSEEDKEPESGSDESSSEEESDMDEEEKKAVEEYQEETARALQEDRLVQIAAQDDKKND